MNVGMSKKKPATVRVVLDVFVSLSNCLVLIQCGYTIPVLQVGKGYLFPT